jgi:hypothetical protein
MKAAALASILLLVACAPVAAPPPAAPRVDPAKERARFEEEETRALRLLAAADRRIALRAGITPTDDEKHKTGMGAILSEDPTTVLLDGTPDPMSFEARKRALDSAEKTVSPGSEPRDERLLFKRFIAEERMRLARERRLPQSASDVVRAIVETWTPPPTMDAAGGRDQWLAQRLDDIRASLSNATLTTDERDELEDALDPLEKLANGLNGSMKSLTELRLALGRVQTAPSHAPDEKELFAEIQAYLGWEQGKTALVAALEQLEKELRAEVEPSLTSLDAKSRRDLGERVAALLTSTACDRREVSGSMLRSMRPPPERAGACAAAAELCAAGDVKRALAPLVALHEWTVLALWAIRGAPLGARFVSDVEPDKKSDLTRMAFVRPVVAVGAALYARELFRASLEETRAHACSVVRAGNALPDAI